MNSFFQYWLKNQVTTFFTIIILCVFIWMGLSKVSIGPNANSDNIQFTVIIEYFGLDGDKIEDIITIPLEQLVTRINGIKEIRSVSEKNKSKVNIVINSNINSEDFYFSLREAVDILYADLPSSVQRPQIFSTTTNTRPFMIITFPVSSVNEMNSIFDIVDRTLKPRIQKIQGVGEINVGGNEQKEIHIVVDSQKASQYKLNYNTIAEHINSNYYEVTLGDLDSYQQNTPIVFMGRFDNIEELKNLHIPLSTGNNIKLKNIANIEFARRELEKISRVDSEKNIALYIKSSNSKYIVESSQKIRNELENFKEEFSIDYNVLYDYGEHFSTSANNILKTLLQSMLVLSIFLIIYFRNIFLALTICIFLPIEIMISITLVTLFNLNISIELLVGISISIGLLTDTGVIILNEINNSSIEQLPRKMTRITPPLFASIITTLVVMIPLFYLPAPTKAIIIPIIIAMTILLMVTFLLHIFFFPSLYVFSIKLVQIFKVKIKAPNTSSFMYVLNQKIVCWIKKIIIQFYQYNKITFIVITVCLGWFIISIIVIPKSTSTSILDEPVIFANLQFDSGTSVIEVDTQTNQFVTAVRQISGVERVESLSNKNQSTISIKFDSKQYKKHLLIKELRELNANFPGIGVIINNTINKETRLEIALIGQDINKLRDYAKNLSSQFLLKPDVLQAILHFKEGEPMWEYQIDNNKAIAKGITPQAITSILRWYLHGPVSLKWFDAIEEKELDVRIKGTKDSNNTIDNIKTYTIKGVDAISNTPLNSIGNFTLKQKPDVIFHLNKQRAVYFSLLLSDNNINNIFSSISNELNTFEFEEGYSYRIDKALLDLKQQYNLLILLIIIAICITYMFLAGYYESFTTPLIIIIGIPLSLSIIGITYFILQKNFTTYTLVAMIIVIGLVVNNIILLIDAIIETKSKNILQALKLRSKPVLITSFSTIISLIPMLLTKSNSALIAEFSLVILLGIIGSLISTFVFIPTILKSFPQLLVMNKNK